MRAVPIWLVHKLPVVYDEVSLDWVGKVRRFHTTMSCVRGAGGEQGTVISSTFPEMSRLQADLKPRTSQDKQEILLERLLVLAELQSCASTPNMLLSQGDTAGSSFNGWFSRRATCKQTAGVGTHVSQNYNLTFLPVFSLCALWGSEPCLPHLSSRACVVCTLWCQQPALRWIGTFGFPSFFRITSFPSRRDGVRADTNLTSPFLKGLAASLLPVWLIRRHSQRVTWSQNEPWFNRWELTQSTAHERMLAPALRMIVVLGDCYVWCQDFQHTKPGMLGVSF